MQNAVELSIQGIKCDNTNCDYEDNNTKFEPDRYLNQPCPKCGESLLTPEDYKLAKDMFSLEMSLNELFGDMSQHKGKSIVSTELKMNGTGIQGLEVGEVRLDKPET